MKIVGNKVLGHMGDVLAEKVYGEWQSKDPSVIGFIKAEEEAEVVRARTQDGKFIPDDPVTPEVNEAWTTKLTKKVKKK